METTSGHLTFCTNIFPGESWEAHFDLLKSEVPVIKKKLAPHQPFGIGLRLSNRASIELVKPERLKEFKKWLQENEAVVKTMNGFPYGNFHKTRVKDQVHKPDWTTSERLDYTLRLFKILSELLPENTEGGVSTAPLSYKYWFKNKKRAEIKRQCTKKVVDLVLRLFQIHQTTGQQLHLDIEPEADGLIENSDEFIIWYSNDLLPEGMKALSARFSLNDEDAAEAVRNHVQLCYDVCHFAVGFEGIPEVIRKLNTAGIRIGKWQLSAALKVKLTEDQIRKKQTLKELRKFDEPVYLHQVVAQMKGGMLRRYRDLPDAYHSEEAMKAEEWRAHFHVPLFINDYGLLQSTRDEVLTALKMQKEEGVSKILEVETYTWDILPEEIKRPLSESIIREMEWVMNNI